MTQDQDQAASNRIEAVELVRGLRLAGLAMLSAIVTATVVIGVGGAWIDRSARSAQTSALQAPEPAH